jgi:nucleoside-diphosphate-sugar epimerase
MVGTFVTPYLARRHELRVLDVRPPQHGDLVDYVEGSISDPAALARALEGMDTFVDMVMRWPGKGPSDQTVGDIIANHEVNVLGVHLLLWTAQSMGVKRGVYISTRTVHDLPTTAEGRPTYFQAEETMPLDNPSVYGLTKGLGERVCEYFAQHFDMRIIALRITGPRTRDAFLAERRVPVHPGLYVMDEEDLADAILSALDVVQVGSGRFDAILVSGDEREVDHNMTKARVVLGYAPKGQLLLDDQGPRRGGPAGGHRSAGPVPDGTVSR